VVTASPPLVSPQPASPPLDDDHTVVRTDSRQSGTRYVPSTVQDPPPARPALLGFRLGDSQIVALDAIIYLGRKPSVPRIVRDGDTRLVRVLSPTSEVSATHIELRQIGATVVVTDLRSTNGTSILVPGFPVRTLRPGEALTVSRGALIDVGDGNILEIVEAVPLS
jgi:pSer/pThr/pTyr-binding forkhead associated (FHA) protein